MYQDSSDEEMFGDETSDDDDEDDDDDDEDEDSPVRHRLEWDDGLQRLELSPAQRQYLLGCGSPPQCRSLLFGDQEPSRPELKSQKQNTTKL